MIAINPRLRYKLRHGWNWAYSLFKIYIGPEYHQLQAVSAGIIKSGLSIFENSIFQLAIIQSFSLTIFITRFVYFRWTIYWMIDWRFCFRIKRLSSCPLFDNSTWTCDISSQLMLVYLSNVLFNSFSISQQKTKYKLISYHVCIVPYP